MFLTREHCLATKSLKCPAFSFKSTINLSLQNKGGEHKVSFDHLERSFKVTSMTLDLFSCLRVVKISLYNTFTWILQLKFLNIVKEVETY